MNTRNVYAAVINTALNQRELTARVVDSCTQLDLFTGRKSAWVAVEKILLQDSQIFEQNKIEQQGNSEKTIVEPRTNHEKTKLRRRNRREKNGCKN